MSCKRGGEGNVGTKRYRPFAYDSMATFFDVVLLEARKEICCWEVKRLGVDLITHILR